MTALDRLDAARYWAEDERLLLEQVRRLADTVIATAAAAHDRDGTFPWGNIKAINDLGLNGLFVPEEYGGSPMRYRVYLEVVRIISEACAATKASSRVVITSRMVSETKVEVS